MYTYIAGISTVGFSSLILSLSNSNESALESIVPSWSVTKEESGELKEVLLSQFQFPLQAGKVSNRNSAKALIDNYQLLDDSWDTGDSICIEWLKIKIILTYIYNFIFIL